MPSFYIYTYILSSIRIPEKSTLCMYFAESVHQVKLPYIHLYLKYPGRKMHGWWELLANILLHVPKTLKINSIHHGNTSPRKIYEWIMDKDEMRTI